MESREISVCVGQGRRPSMNLCDLWALRRLCMRNHHATLLNTATSAKEYFRKPFSLNTVWRCIKKWHLNLCYTRRKVYISYMQRWVLRPELISDGLEDSGKVCSGQMRPCFSLFWGKIDIGLSVPKKKGTNQTFISDRCKSKHLSCGVHQCKWYW